MLKEVATAVAKGVAIAAVAMGATLFTLNAMSREQRQQEQRYGHRLEATVWDRTDD